jgi:hypothetical protein
MTQSGSIGAKQKKCMQRFTPFIFLGLVFTIMWPLYQPGYIFLLDMVWGPGMSLTRIFHTSPTYGLPWNVLFAIIGKFVHPALVQKTVLTLVLFCIPWSMYRLLRDRVQWSSALLGSVIYFLNPYVYERFIAGQWLVLAGYAFFPVVIKGLTQALTDTSRKSFVNLALILAFYPIISLHWSYITYGIVAIAVLIYGHEHQNKSSYYHHVGFYACITLVLFLGLNSYWLFGQQNIVSTITFDDFRLFQTVGDPHFGPIGNVLSLYGFWQQDAFLPKDFNSTWWIITVVYLMLSTIGAWRFFKKHDILGITFLVTFVPTVIIAIGYATPLTRHIIDFLYYIPGFKGLRDTAKIIGLIAFTYALFVPIGLQWLLLQFKGSRNYRQLVIGISLIIGLLPFISVSTLFWGNLNHIQSADYPESWYKAQSKIEQDKGATILFLPWHGYLRFPMSQGRLIANPGPVFFNQPVISGPVADTTLSSSQPKSDWDVELFKLLQGQSAPDQVIPFFISHHITHIILAKTADWDRYTWLNQSKKLSAIFESPDLIVYKIKSTE